MTGGKGAQYISAKTKTGGKANFRASANQIMRLRHGKKTNTTTNCICNRAHNHKPRTVQGPVKYSWSGAGAALRKYAFSRKRSLARISRKLPMVASERPSNDKNRLQSCGGPAFARGLAGCRVDDLAPNFEQLRRQSDKRGPPPLHGIAPHFLNRSTVRMGPIPAGRLSFPEINSAIAPRGVA